MRGTKREAQPVAAALESASPASTAGGRSVEDVLRAWQEVIEAVWSDASRRDYGSRVGFVLHDPIAQVGLARLGVADVERWHARMRRAGVDEQAVRNRHSVLRAQAVRWAWPGTNVAAAARLQQRKHTPRESMTPAEMQAVVAAAGRIDPLAGLALRLAAVAGLRRAELAALRWDDVRGDRLVVDSSVACHTAEGGAPVLVDAQTKTANRRSVLLDPATRAEIACLRTERAEVSP